MKTTNFRVLKAVREILENNSREEMNNLFVGNEYSYYDAINYFNRKFKEYAHMGSIENIIRELMNKGLLFHEFLIENTGKIAIIPIYSLSEDDIVYINIRRIENRFSYFLCEISILSNDCSVIDETFIHYVSSVDEDVCVLTKVDRSSISDLWFLLKTTISAGLDTRFITENIMFISIMYKKEGLVVPGYYNGDKNFSIMSCRSNAHKQVCEFAIGGSEHFDIEYIKDKYSKKFKFSVKNVVY